MGSTIEGEAQRIEKRISNLQRRLQELQKRQDLCGWNTPPEVSIEIEDIEAKIEKLQRTLKKLEDGVKLSSGDLQEKYRLSVVNDLKKTEGTEEGASIGRDVHSWLRGASWKLVMVVIVILVFLPVVVFWLNSREISCPHKVLVLIRSFEGSGDLNVERSIHEAFGKAISGLAQTGTGQINVQIIEEDFVIPNVDHVFVVEGWYDNADVHTNISQKNGNQFSPLKDCCPPGEASAVSAVVAIKVSYYVARIWQKEGCSEAAFELLLQLIRQSDLDPEWEKMLCEFAREG